MTPPRISLARATEIATQAARKGALQPGAPKYLADTHNADWAAHDWVIQAVMDAHADGIAAATVDAKIRMDTPDDMPPMTVNALGLKMVVNKSVPPGEIHFVDNNGRLQGRIVNVDKTPREDEGAMPGIDHDMNRDGFRTPRMYDAWKHRETGRIYFVNMVSNDHTSDHVKFPTTVIYTHVPTDQTWSRPLADFMEKFEYVGVKASATPTPTQRLEQRYKDAEEEQLDIAAENLVGATKMEIKLSLKAMVDHESREMRPLIAALKKIWKWYGEFPSHIPASGERDHMRRVAAMALKREMSEPLPMPDITPGAKGPGYQ